MPIFKKVNHNFFKTWSREMSYILGFFAADGYMTLNKRGAHFWNIEIVDRDLLYKIRKTIQSNHKISIRKKKAKNSRTQYRLQIGSVSMYRDLEKIGYSMNKTKIMSVPHVPREYLADFVRGYFDGDGSVWVGYVHKERKTKTLAIQTVFTSCSKNFLTVLQDILESFGVVQGRLRKGNGNYYRLVYSIKNSLNLYDFMYNRVVSSDLFLARKKKIFDQYKNMRL